MATSKVTILIAEDDQAIILRGLSDVLVFNGYTVEEVEDGGEGYLLEHG